MPAGPKLRRVGRKTLPLKPVELYHTVFFKPQTRKTMNRVVVTGIGAITPLGNDTITFWQQLQAGVSGAGPITHFDASQFKTRFACEVKGFDASSLLDRSELKRTDLFTQYALVAADQAIRDSGFDAKTMDPFDIGVIWGSGQGGMQTF